MSKFIELIETIINWFAWLFRRKTEGDQNMKAVEGRLLSPIRVLVLLTLIALPGLLYLQSAFRMEQMKLVLPALKKCPSLTSIPLQELRQQPQRFLSRQIWIAGKLLQGKKRCIKRTCATNTQPCCLPCQATLQLQQGDASVELKGLVLGELLSCVGTTCKLTCKPLKLNRWYAFSGNPHIASRPHPKTGQPTFSFEHFQATAACRLTGPLENTSSVRMPEPLLFRPRPRSPLPLPPR